MIGIRKKGGDGCEQQGIVDVVKDAKGMTLFLERRENKNLTQSNGMRRLVERVSKNVEKTITNECGMIVDGGIESEHNPAMRRILSDYNFTCSIDKPVRKGLNLE